MRRNVARNLSFALVLALMPLAFPTKAAAAHVHDYAVTTNMEYGWVNNDYHSVTEVHTHLCSCGAMYREHHNKPNEGHTPTGSGVYEGSYLGEGGKSYDTYRYTCRNCKSTYRKSMVSSFKSVVEEEVEE